MKEKKMARKSKKSKSSQVVKKECTTLTRMAVDQAKVQLSRVDRSAAEQTGNSEIDFTDIPELSDTQLKKMKRIGRPPLGNSPRKMISIKLDPELLEELKSEAKKLSKPYQSLIHEILQQYMQNRVPN